MNRENENQKECKMNANSNKPQKTKANKDCDEIGFYRRVVATERP
jgi:poly(3-hydroxybutyrate) depolymerase